MYRRTNIEIMPDRQFDAGIKSYLSDDDYLTLQETFTEAEAQAIYPHPESELAAPYAQKANVYEVTEYSWQLGIDIAIPDLPWWQWNLDPPKFDLPDFPPWTWPSLPPSLSPTFPPWAWPSLPPINWDFTWPDLPTWQPSLPPWTWPDMPSWDIDIYPPWTIQWPDFGLVPYKPPGLPSVSPWPELAYPPDVESHYESKSHYRVTFFCNELGCYCPGGETEIKQRCAHRVIDVEPVGDLPAGVSVRVKGGRICVTASDSAKGSFEVNVVMAVTVNGVNGPTQIIGRAWSKQIDLCSEDECNWCSGEWDKSTSAETVDPDSSCLVAVTVDPLEECGPLIWSVSGKDFFLEDSETTDRFNTLIAGPASCGSASITVTCADGTIIKGYVRSTDGCWFRTNTYYPCPNDNMGWYCYYPSYLYMTCEKFEDIFRYRYWEMDWGSGGRALCDEDWLDGNGTVTCGDLGLDDCVSSPSVCNPGAAPFYCGREDDCVVAGGVALCAWEKYIWGCCWG